MEAKRFKTSLAGASAWAFVDKKPKIGYNGTYLCRVDIRALSVVWTGSCHTDEGKTAVRMSHPAAGNTDLTSLYFGITGIRRFFL